MIYMIVDASHTARKMVVRALDRYIDAQKDTIIYAEDGAIAVALYREYSPDFVFMNLTLPVMDGFEAMEQIRAFDPDARIVILDTDRRQDTAQRVLQNGALHYIDKPLDIRKIDRLFSHHLVQETP